MDSDNIKDNIAREIINISHGSILVKMRFMGTALNRLDIQTSDISFATDGRLLLYNPDYIIKCYKSEPNIVTRNYMHLYLHCIFNHMYCAEVWRPAWDTACDIAVENIMNEWNIPMFNVERTAEQREILASFKKMKLVTAEKLYSYFIDSSYSEQKLNQLHEIFFADTHDLWYIQNNACSGGNMNGLGSDENYSESHDTWKRLSEQIQTDLETFSKDIGDSAGDMMMNLKELNRERYDYTSFLRKFAVLGEKMMINNDEFDHNFYTYGLELYENMPLIEPLEYKEIKCIREFIIAIDTSGSVSGDEVQSFVRKTYNILSQQENFFTKVNIHIIQCDCAVQEDVKITSNEDFNKYIEDMKLYGFGGTDFRPVFEYVSRLINEHEFTDLKGMIYFTDGYGIFPEKRPAYETAFVFVTDDVSFVPEVPPWAIKLVLARNELT